MLAFALLCAGCAMERQPMGPPVQPPALVADAFVAPDGVALPLRSWLPEGRPSAVVVALHGMNDYSNAFDMPGRFWARHGVATYAYDQRGFGAGPRPGVWADTETMAADLDAAVQAVAARHPGVPVFLLGESMGGAVVAAALTAAPAPGRPPLAERVAGAVLSAPAVWGRASLNPLYRFTLWLAYSMVPGLVLEPPRDLKIQPSDNIEMLRALGRDPLVIKRTRVDAVKGLVDLMTRAEDAMPALPPRLPLLVLYGRHEEVLPKPAIGRALAALETARPGTQVGVYERGYHMLLRDLQAEAVWKDVLAWLRMPGTRLPSGADRVPWEPPEAERSKVASNPS
ncbi:alpha/beta fold hydrolase [Arenibaculum pallidiluteum]|uniref:alpha/beta fold hydrolase n=1 Tax=Arenibaculum pallidiluteum TaxID=2812559 RepID=UPI001A963DE6|nr:alpha/beta fold hydrolase [Arenibaculum pallidiluteum]